MADDDDGRNVRDLHGNLMFQKQPSVISRKEWGAVDPTKVEPLNGPVKNVRFTITKTDICTTKEDCINTVRELQKDAMKRGLSDIEYNFLVGGDHALLFEGRGWEADAWRPLELAHLNGNCIDIAFIGDFKGGGCLTQAMDETGMSVIEWGQKAGHIEKNPEPNIIPYLETSEHSYFESNLDMSTPGIWLKGD